MFISDLHLTAACHSPKSGRPSIVDMVISRFSFLKVEINNDTRHYFWIAYIIRMMIIIIVANRSVLGGANSCK